MSLTKKILIGLGFFIGIIISIIGNEYSKKQAEDKNKIIIVDIASDSVVNTVDTLIIK